MRYTYFFVCVLVMATSSWGYGLFGLAFINVPTEYQFLLAIFCPIIRQIFVWLLTRTAYKATGKCALRITDISCAHYMETRHCLFLGK